MTRVGVNVKNITSVSKAEFCSSSGARRRTKLGITITDTSTFHACSIGAPPSHFYVPEQWLFPGLCPSCDVGYFLSLWGRPLLNKNVYTRRDATNGPWRTKSVTHLCYHSRIRPRQNQQDGTQRRANRRSSYCCSIYRALFSYHLSCGFSSSVAALLT